jgi:hypothetical protein
MNRTRVLFMILFVLVVGVLLVDSGIPEYFSDVVHERNGWRKTTYGYAKQTIMHNYTYYYTILKDPEPPNENCEVAVYSGAMKKSAVDRMELIESSSITANSSFEDLRKQIEKICKEKGGNTIIIDGQAVTASTEVKSWAF